MLQALICRNLLSGSFGTLAAMVSVTIKVLPSPEQDANSYWSLDLDDNNGCNSGIIRDPYKALLRSMLQRIYQAGIAIEFSQ